MITVDDVLHVLVARTNAPSSMGAQLARLEQAVIEQPPKKHRKKWKIGDPPIPPEPQIMSLKEGEKWTSMDHEEERIFQTIGPIRCLDALARLQSGCRCFTDRPALGKLHKCVPERTQGELVIQCLRAYQEWATISQERALVAVYLWARALAPDVFPVALHDEATLAHAFAQSKAKAARRKAADLYSDCLLTVSTWVGMWNRAGGKTPRYSGKDAAYARYMSGTGGKP